MVHSWRFFPLDYGRQADFSAPTFNVPNGLIEIVFLQDLQIYEAQKNQLPEQLPAAFVWGQTKTGSRIFTSGMGTWFEVKLYPWAFNLLFGHTTASLPSGATPLTALHKDFTQLQEQILQSTNASEALQVFEKFALERLRQANQLQPFLLKAFQMIYASHGNKKISTICQQLNVSRQYLHQYFSEKIGLSPKAFAKIVRLRHTVDRIYCQQGKSLTEISLDAGYFDQAHFINDFKAVLDQSPMAFFKQKQFIVWDMEME